MINSTSSQQKIEKFCLEGQHFHGLSQLQNTNDQIFQIQDVNQIFKFSKEQLCLLSPKLFEFIESHSDTFLISLPLNKVYQNISSKLLIKAFEKLISLFSTKSQIKITKSNVHVYQYLNDIFDNPFLSLTCCKALLGSYQYFKLTSKILSNLPKQLQDLLNNFIVYVNNKPIHCNKYFA
jgi:hypothetical protein